MQAAAAALSLPLFRAMAEVALLLTQPEAETAAAPDEPAQPAAEAEEEIIVSKEVAAPLDYDYGDEDDETAPGASVLLADGQEHALLPPIDEQD
ncbi:hypothetical protein D3C81_526670 [compost metagenome]